MFLGAVLFAIAGFYALNLLQYQLDMGYSHAAADQVANDSAYSVFKGYGPLSTLIFIGKIAVIVISFLIAYVPLRKKFA